MGIDILVPVLGRPQNAAKVAESLKVTKSDYRLVFIASPNDTEQIAACREIADVLVVDWAPGKADYAKKINTGFSETQNEWVFQGADDIVFSDGWDEAALFVATKNRKRVIGTNDLHNPSVKKAMHSTHTLFARSYIEEWGGTLDDTGTVLCELYDHQYVDTEFIAVARKRREWAFARRSIVEHLHPHWGLAETDKTYAKAMRQTGRDMRLYKERMGIVTRSRGSDRFRERQEAMRKAKEARLRR